MWYEEEVPRSKEEVTFPTFQAASNRPLAIRRDNDTATKIGGKGDKSILVL